MISHSASSGKLSIIFSENTGKSYHIDEDGTVVKRSGGQIWSGIGKTLPPMDADAFAETLAGICSRSDSVLMMGSMRGAPTLGGWQLHTEAELRDIAGIPPEAPRPTSSVKNETGHHGARIQSMLLPSEWLLLDADTPLGMPPELARLSLAERLAALEPVIPGISRAERIELRSSSARVVAPGATPGRASHAWIRISHPERINLLRHHAHVTSVASGLSWPSPKYRKGSSDVVATAWLGLLDWSVWSVGRLVFCSAPSISPAMEALGWSVAGPDIRIINKDAGPLDIGWIHGPPHRDAMASFAKKTGEKLAITGTEAVSWGSLKWDEVIESRGTSKTLREWVDGMTPGQKLRCETPFRESRSEAAFLSLDASGEPMLYDSGTQTMHRLVAPPIPLPPLATPVRDEEQLRAALASVSRLPPDRKTGQQGKALATIDNILQVLSCFSLRYDAATDSEEIGTEWGSWRPMQNGDETLLAADLDRLGFAKTTKEERRDCLSIVARQHAVDTYQEWLTSLSWDGTPRVATFAVDYMGCEAGPYAEALSLYLWRALAQRIIAPGCQVDSVPILIGPQGVGKSTLALALSPFPEAAATVALDVRDEELSRRLKGKIIVEFGELRGLSGRDAESTKEFITRRVEDIRPLYAQRHVRWPRRCVFIGTSNNESLLADTTGHRRWLPIHVGKCDVARLVSDRDQLWAEALTLGRHTEELERELQALASGAQLAAEIRDEWLEGKLEALELSQSGAGIKLFGVIDWIFMRQIGAAQQKNLTAAMTRRGWEQKRTAKARFWYPPK